MYMFVIRVKYWLSALLYFVFCLILHTVPLHICKVFDMIVSPWSVHYYLLTYLSVDLKFAGIC